MGAAPGCNENGLEFENGSLCCGMIKVLPVLKKSWGVTTVTTTTTTVYFINPSEKLKLLFDRTTKNMYISIVLNHEPPAHTHS